MGEVSRNNLRYVVATLGVLGVMMYLGQDRLEQYFLTDNIVDASIYLEPSDAAEALCSAVIEDERRTVYSWRVYDVDVSGVSPRLIDDRYPPQIRLPALACVT